MRTEQIDPRYVDLDSWSVSEMIAAMYDGQLEAAGAVRGALGAIAAAVEDAVPALQRDGRIVYVGAGTSGRIGVQDGAELTPTYDWPEDRLVFAMAGGLDALVRSSEGAEDNEGTGAKAMTDAKIGANDVVRPCRERHDSLHDRRAASRFGGRRGHDRCRQQPGGAALRCRAPSHSGRYRQRSCRRLNPDESRHLPQNRPEPVLDGRDGEARPCLPRNDGRHAGAKRQAASARGSHGQQDRPVHGARGCRSS